MAITPSLVPDLLDSGGKKLSLDKCCCLLDKLTQSIDNLGNKILQGITRPLTGLEESADSLESKIRDQIESRLKPIEESVNDLETKIQNDLLGKYAPLINQLEEIANKYPIDEGEQDESQDQLDDSDTRKGPLQDTEDQDKPTQPGPQQSTIPQTPTQPQQSTQPQTSTQCIDIKECKPLRLTNPDKEDDTKDSKPKECFKVQQCYPDDLDDKYKVNDQMSIVEPDPPVQFAPEQALAGSDEYAQSLE